MYLGATVLSMLSKTSLYNLGGSRVCKSVTSPAAAVKVSASSSSSVLRKEKLRDTSSDEVHWDVVDPESEESEEEEE